MFWLKPTKWVHKCQLEWLNLLCQCEPSCLGLIYRYSRQFHVLSTCPAGTACSELSATSWKVTHVVICDFDRRLCSTWCHIDRTLNPLSRTTFPSRSTVRTCPNRVNEEGNWKMLMRGFFCTTVTPSGGTSFATMRQTQLSVISSRRYGIRNQYAH